MVEWREKVPSSIVLFGLTTGKSAVRGARIVHTKSLGGAWIVRWRFDTPEETLAADEMMLNLVRARYGGTHAP